jgi:chromosome condensin MukBEF ATPase and DNA-binding subunit MukB
LRPLTFTWKQGGVRDVGLAAEEVAEVEPLLTFRNDKGEIEGVKYNQISVVLINAIKQQQEQIERYETRLAEQQERLDRQQNEIESLKRLVCASYPQADACTPSRQPR